MSKIEEILRSHYSNREVEGLYHQFELLEMVAHEYAEWYAKKCLESAASSATTYSDVGGYTFVDSDSILNIKLPNHE